MKKDDNTKQQTGGKQGCVMEDFMKTIPEFDWKQNRLEALYRPRSPSQTTHAARKGWSTEENSRSGSEDPIPANSASHNLRAKGPSSEFRYSLKLQEQPVHPASTQAVLQTAMIPKLCCKDQRLHLSLDRSRPPKKLPFPKRQQLQGVRCHNTRLDRMSLQLWRLHLRQDYKLLT